MQAERLDQLSACMRPLPQTRPGELAIHLNGSSRGGVERPSSRTRVRASHVPAGVSRLRRLFLLGFADVSREGTAATAIAAGAAEGRLG